MDKERHTQIARKGGLSVSKNREHMATIGRKGGLKTQQKLRDKKEAEYLDALEHNNHANAITNPI